jgi:hypothetical protein
MRLLVWGDFLIRNGRAFLYLVYKGSLPIEDVAGEILPWLDRYLGQNGGKLLMR